MSSNTAPNLRKRRFAREYIKDLNGTEAAIRAGYAKKGAHVTASRLLSDPKVQEMLGEARREVEKVATVKAAAVIDELGLIATSDIGAVFHSSPDGRYLTVRRLDDLPLAARRAIKSIRQTTQEHRDEEGRYVEKVVLQVELHPKTQALDLLMQHYGLKKPEKLDVHVEVTSAKSAVEAKLNELRKRNRPEPTQLS